MTTAPNPANLPWDQLEALRDASAAAAEGARQALADLERFEQLVMPHFAALGPDAELGDVLMAMPPADRAEALAVLERLS